MRPAPGPDQKAHGDRHTGGPGEAPDVADIVTRAVSRLEAVTSLLPAGQLRHQQVEMCRAVAVAIATGRHLIAQAGTGTGKSLAYAVPAAVSGKKVVVATATKALQDQLAHKDLPIIAGLPGTTFSFAVLKGRSNYLCLQRAAEMSGRGVQQSFAAGELTGAGAGGDESPGGDVAGPDGAGDRGTDAVTPAAAERLVDQVRAMLRWSEETRSGDRAELPFEPHPRAWAMLSVGPRECPGAFRCPSGSHCFAERARTAAAEADIVVVNTHLYGAHLASGGVVLPPHDVVVFDEAHEVEAIMTASLGAEITPGRFRALHAAARPLLPGDEAARLLEQLAELPGHWQSALEGALGRRVLRGPRHEPGAPTGGEVTGRGEPAGRARVREPAAALSPNAADDELSRLLELSATRVEQLSALLRAEPPSDDGSAGHGARSSPDDAGRRARTLVAAGHLSGDLGRIAGRTGDEVVWVDGTHRLPVLRLSPIDVGPPLAETLWGSATAVLTSATIPPRITERLGLSAFAVDSVDVGSPFDYRSHALLYAARHLPDRRRAESESALHEEMDSLIRAAGGRTLALFTSRRATESAAEALRPRLPYRVLLQGELPKARLLEAFAEEESSCLFATLGFWQGVDVPGRSLSLVTLDRLPFARPDDPLFEARRERAGGDAFRTVDLPRAATLLAQGAGRLIRSADDFGVVAVLDPRLATAGYRGALLAGLPPMRRTTELRQAEDFLRRILSGKQDGRLP